jgi:hypothetical protein
MRDAAPDAGVNALTRLASAACSASAASASRRASSTRSTPSPTAAGR